MLQSFSGDIHEIIVECIPTFLILMTFYGEQSLYSWRDSFISSELSSKVQLIEVILPQTLVLLYFLYWLMFLSTKIRKSMKSQWKSQKINFCISTNWFWSLHGETKDLKQLKLYWRKRTKSENWSYLTSRFTVQLR